MRLERIASASATQAGGTTSGSAIVTGLATSALEGALRVRGPGVPRQTYVRSIDSPSQVTLTKNATATNASASLTFDIEPVMLQDAKDQLRISTDFHDDDSSIARNITAARIAAEDWHARAYITQQFRLRLDGFTHVCRSPRRGLDQTAYERQLVLASSYPNRGILIPVADLIAVSSLGYLDPNGGSHVLDGGGYQVIPGTGGYVIPSYGTSWPSSRPQPDSVAIDFTAGYGDTAESVPSNVKEAILMLVAHFYENREATVTSSIGLKEAPLAVQSLLSLEDWGYRG